MSREEFNGGRMMAGNLPVVPTRASLSASNRPAPTDTLQRGAQSQRFFSNSRAGAAQQPFERQAAQVQQSIQRNGQFKPITADAGRGMTNVPRPAQNSAGEFHGNSLSGSQAARGTSTMESQGWRRFNSNTGQNQAGAQNSNSRYSRGSSVGAASTGYRSSQAGSSVRSESVGNNEGWRHFTPQSGGAMQDPRGLARGEDGLRGPQASPRSYSRPPLEMRQPIVTPRTTQVGGPARGGYPGGASHGGGGGGGSHGGGGGSAGHSGGSGHRR